MSCSNNSATTPSGRVQIRRITSGIETLDSILGGGIPSYSTNIIAGGPGTGKTILAHQITFHNASAKAPAIFFVAQGEPTIKLLRYQQQLSFFDHQMLDRSVFYYDLGNLARTEGLNHTLSFIAEKVAFHYQRPLVGEGRIWYDTRTP